MRPLQDLPVSVELPGTLGVEVSAWVEAEAGWQVVAPDGPPPPVLSLVGEPRAGRACVVINDGRGEAEPTRRALLAGALDVVAWPEERERLLDAPLRIPHRATTGAGPPLVRVAGAAGGAGTSTVTLALAGLLAWSGRRALAVGGDGLLALCDHAPWRGPGIDQLASLSAAHAAAELASLARPVAGVRGLAVLGGGWTLPSVAGWPADVVVVDVGTGLAASDADVVVARADASAVAARHAVGPVLVTAGAASGAQLRRLLGRPPHALLPRSARVARAGLVGRVPADLPGSFLRQLRPVVRAVAT